MDSEWMGRYRPLVASLVRHTNVINRAMSNKEEVSDGIFLNPNEWQVLEYIVEHRDNTFNMIDISRQLGIPQSSFSKIVKTLKQYQLADKYIAENNRKNIILRPTDKAIKVYKARTDSVTRKRFEAFFECLKDLPDEAITIFTNALDTLNRTLENEESSSKSLKLIKQE